MKPITGWKKNWFWKIFLNADTIPLSKAIPRPRTLLLKIQLRKRSNLKVICDAAELISCNETQTSETECAEVCRSNYPAKQRVMRPKIQRRYFVRYSTEVKRYFG